MKNKKIQPKKPATKRKKNALTANDQKHLVPVVVKLLKTAKGHSKAVNNTYIKRYVRHQTGISLYPHQVRSILHHIRTKGLVNCVIAAHAGYFIATNANEIVVYRKALQKRIKEIAHISAAIRKQAQGQFAKQKQLKSRKMRKTITSKRKK